MHYPMIFEAVRAFALSLPEITDAPHFERTSFPVSRKIFVYADAWAKAVQPTP